jgi:V/A-type H+-transporting ATPase subunit I
MMPSYISGVVVAIILVGGHIFNLVVNTLGAFIHSARLQFVEFFGKFIYGTGRQFRPFARQERNIVIEQK